MPIKFLLAIPALLLIAGLSGQPVRADALADAVAAIPAGVEEIHFAGSWSAGDAGGTYRVIVLRTGGKPITARLFLQWIALGDEPSIAQSVEIEEFAALKVDVADVFLESDVDGLAVHIESTQGDGYELFASGPGEYRFGRASN
jgi:hypothetical protein